jgi:hypothetical protein
VSFIFICFHILLGSSSPNPRGVRSHCRYAGGGAVVDKGLSSNSARGGRLPKRVYTLHNYVCTHTCVHDGSFGLCGNRCCAISVVIKQCLTRFFLYIYRLHVVKALEGSTRLLHIQKWGYLSLGVARATGTPGAVCIARIMVCESASAHHSLGQLSLRRARATRTPVALCMPIKGCARPVSPVRSACQAMNLGTQYRPLFWRDSSAFGGLRTVGRSAASLFRTGDRATQKQTHTPSVV